ncbi:uncharacterized protein [Haliotis asinina]|uniref:uncharacterized protein n=1 Tax=Haliotis asinina TaxID=109174 RepID=UPI0035325AA7
MACSAETSRVSLEDCTCPICMCILIEPVTMPCHHELCRPCFKQNVEEASLLCPMCRTRIGTWARHATKTKTLVNQQRWEQIQELFPKRVRLRLEGKDEEDDSADVSFHRPVHLAAPGEIRKEYEEELNKLRQQLNQERRREEQESEALIRRLQEEEDRERHRRQVQAMQTNENDEALARELDKVINEAGTDDPIDLLLEETKLRITRSNSATSAKSGQSSSGTLETFFSKYKAETDTRCVSEDPYPYACISPSDKDKGEDNSRSNSSIGKLSSSSAKTELYPFNLVDHSYCPHPNAPKSSTVVRPPSDEVMTISDSSSDAGRERGDSAKERSESVVSNDSISNELCHFKPILSCPRTPPRKMADGKVLDPPVVRTTPRNLSRNGFGSPVDAVMSPGLEPGSPIMQKRLNELALERQQLVRERSKSTSTGPDDETHRDDKKSHPLVRERTLSSDLSRPPLHKSDPVPPLVHTDLPDSVSSRSGLLIPLEPILEDHDYEDITPVLLHVSNPGSSLTVSKSREEEEQSVGTSDVRTKTPTHDRQKRSRHLSKDLKGQKNLKAQVISPQRSIKDWFKTSDRESKTESPDLFEENLEVISENQVVDSNANVKQVSGKRECNIEQGSGDAGGLVLPSESILETNGAVSREKRVSPGEVETVSGKSRNEKVGNGKAQVKSGPKRARRNKTPLQLCEGDTSPLKSDSSVGDPVAIKPGRRKGRGLQEEQVKESVSDDDFEQCPEETGKGWRKVSGNKEIKTNEELLVLKSNVRTMRTIKRSASSRRNVCESDCSESETEVLVDNPVSVKKCQKKDSATVSKCSLSESESESEMTFARKQHNMNAAQKVCDADPLRRETNVCVPQRSKRRKTKEDADFDPESLKEISESETDPVTPAKKMGKRRRRVRTDTNRPDVSDKETKSQLLGRKSKGHKDSEDVEHDSEHGDQEDEVLDACKPRRRGKKIKKSDEEHMLSDDGMSSDENMSVKGARSKPTKTAPKRSPVKTPPKRSPKKANLADLKGPSETKVKNVSEEMDLPVPSKRSKLKQCATEELLEENVDPNMNRNNSSEVTSPKGRRTQKRGGSDTLSSADSSGPSPRKRIRAKSSIVSDLDSVFESSPNPKKGKPQQDKKRTKSVASRAWKSQGLEGKGRRRHTTGDQQSIVRYLSGASDVDMREDRDEDAVSDTTEVFSQEEEDRKMAERLQKQFNLEQKFHIAAERFKGGSEQYHFRRKPRYYE